MKQHKFKLGEHVSLQGESRDMASGGGYAITRLLPETSPEPEPHYRIKRGTELHERVASEHLLRSVEPMR